MDNNCRVHIVGYLSEIAYSHETFGEKFYSATIASCRLSDTVDVIPVLFSERLGYTRGDGYVDLMGDFRSHNLTDSNGVKHLILNVFASRIEYVGQSCTETNEIWMNGFICKKSKRRKTPLGRDIVDFMLVLNRKYKHSSYIPCIAWSRNALYLNDSLGVGTNISCYGRIQSREYEKRLDDGTVEIRTAYEVSIASFQVLEETQLEN